MIWKIARMKLAAANRWNIEKQTGKAPS